MDATPQLWPKPITIIGGTGEFESGKSLFGLTIDPGPRTLVYDVEKSTTAYTEIGFKRIDVLDEMQKKYPAGYKPVDLFLWWRDHVRAIPAGKYSVIVVDPMTDIEGGLTDWVFAHPEHFGHTAGQYAKMSGIAWGNVKDHEKAILGDIAARCQTFYYTAHVGREFDGDRPTKNLKAKGKATLSELASLFLWFERKPDEKGIKPDAPSAYVRKSRLMAMKMDGGKLTMHRVLPARLPVATPDAIRAYFAAPAGGRAAVDGEQAKEEGLSADDKLVIEMRTAEANAATALASGATAATVVGKPTAPEAAAPATKPVDEQFQLFERLKKSIGEAKTKGALGAVGNQCAEGLPKLTPTQQQSVKKLFAEARDNLSKSEPAAPPAAGAAVGEVPAAAS